MDEWHLDAVMSCSQKAIGVPPGLCLVCLSQRALILALNEQKQRRTYFACVKHWFPIMKAYEERKPSYFATPAVNLIRALYVATSLILKQGIQRRIQQHQKMAKAFRAAIQAFNLKMVTPNNNTTEFFPLHVAHTKIRPAHTHIYMNYFLTVLVCLVEFIVEIGPC